MDRLFTTLIKKIFVMAIITLTFVDNSYAQQQCRQEVIVKNPSGDLTYGWVDNPEEWFAPRALAVDSKGDIYIGDYVNYRVLKFNKNGVFQTQFRLQAPRKPLRKKEEAGKVGVDHLIQDMALDKDDNLYVLSFFESRVEIYKPNGNFMRSFNYSDEEILGSKGRTKKIKVDRSGNIYLFDPSMGGGMYTSEGRLIKKVIVNGYGKGKMNYDETQMTDFNGFYYEVEPYVLNNKRFDRLTIRDRTNRIKKKCDALKIANDLDGYIYTWDKDGNIYTFDYYLESLDVIKMKIFP